ncbi:uncharacterized protein LOC124280189 [Haliotis rubra]|uniref:uncharacterized protein LOC124280189 n=1 Tax=Haliotis rubra TaxID=36100 RepID=UPI001EE58248|nr:uncharacterized protein LOC124280189 [Haliotis rubra]
MWLKVIFLLLTVYILPTSGFVFNIRSSPDPNRNRCGLRWIKMTIHPPTMYASRCQSATVYTRGCKGGCESYSKIDYERNATNIQRYCSCCSQTEVASIRKPALLPCSDGNVLRIPVKMALTCHCRPCSMSVQQIDIFDLRRLLASSWPSSSIFGG